MANLSDAASQGWMAAMGGTAQGSAHSSVKPGWIAALTRGETAPRGFCDASPFAAPEPVPPPEPAQLNPQSPYEPDEEQAAYARGFAEGRSAAEREAQEALRAQAEQLRSLRLAFRTLDQGARATLAQDLQITVIALCEQVVQDYALDEAALLIRCKTAAARLGDAPGKLTLALHPETLAQLDPDALAGWQVTSDPTLDLGALRLTGPEGAVRDQPADWMRTIREALGAAPETL